MSKARSEGQNPLSVKKDSHDRRILNFISLCRQLTGFISSAENYVLDGRSAWLMH